MGRMYIITPLTKYSHSYYLITVNTDFVRNE
jgi:hypothetical protein